MDLKLINQNLASQLSYGSEKLSDGVNVIVKGAKNLGSFTLATISKTVSVAAKSITTTIVPDNKIIGISAGLTSFYAGKRCDTFLPEMMHRLVKDACISTAGPTLGSILGEIVGPLVAPTLAKVASIGVKGATWAAVTLTSNLANRLFFGNAAKPIEEKKAIAA